MTVQHKFDTAEPASGQAVCSVSTVRSLDLCTEFSAFSVQFSINSRSARGVRFKGVAYRVFLLAVAIAVAVSPSLHANDNVRMVQTKLRDGGFYFGAVDGAYSTALAAALSRYQIRQGLPITGQLDSDTAKALGAKPAVANDVDPAQTSQSWRRLRKRDEQFLAKMTAQRSASPGPKETGQSNTSGRASDSQLAAGTTTSKMPAPLPSPPSDRAAITTTTTATTPVSADNTTTSLAPEFSTERLRDYVAAFVLAGLDPQVGAEADFFADRAKYYNDGMMDRAKIRQDLQRYDTRWPERKFWLAGDIGVEPETQNRVRVTFPLGFKLANGSKTASGKVEKSLVLEAVGDDLQIVAVNERKLE